jgi:C_GCAxxG_C_C family probable redox protein
MDKRVAIANKLAADLYLEHGACSQCVVTAVAEVMEIDLNALIKSAHFLAGGGCLMGSGTCGALAAGELVLGHYFGRERDEFSQGNFKERLRIGKELREKFHQKYGGVTCNDFREKLVGKLFDMWSEEDVTASKKLMKKDCAEMTGSVAGWVIETILG